MERGGKRQTKEREKGLDRKIRRMGEINSSQLSNSVNHLLEKTELKCYVLVTV